MGFSACLVLTGACQLDFDLTDYVAQLREGILEAYTGVVTGFKNTDKSPYFRLGLIFWTLILICILSTRTTSSCAQHPGACSPVFS